MHYADRLALRIKKTSPVCVGLDPMLASLPEGIEKSPAGVEKFCKGIINAVKDTACSVKPQLAYFELLGWEGMKVFFEICAYAQKHDLIVIADGKRNDIGSTCEAYAEAYLGKEKPIDALTISPYLGSDGITPFVKACMKNDRGIYVLVKTSNPSAGELQDLPTGDEAVHEHLAQLVESWASVRISEKSSLSCIGAVVGATYLEELKYLRTLMPHVPFLIPGYGAQGGTALDCKAGFLPNGTGAIVNAARSIIYASKEKDWQKAAAKTAESMAEELQKTLT
ncbi:orotidine-5'-phosphate decarboxylase [Candidatus Peribacteria bacterium]|nr:orotidine-5'-phosphate decarboxylase [Candidatus Peribacteria bacterium]